MASTSPNTRIASRMASGEATSFRPVDSERICCMIQTLSEFARTVNGRRSGIGRRIRPPHGSWAPRGIIGSVAYRALTIGFVSGELDQRVRLAAFQWLRAQMDVIGDVLPRSVLAEGFVLDGERVPLLGPQGIFKPRTLSRTPCHRQWRRRPPAMSVVPSRHGVSWSNVSAPGVDGG